MMTSSNRNIFCVTDPLCGESTGHHAKANDTELWCFLWSAPWVKNHEAGDWRHHRSHYDVIVMKTSHIFILLSHTIRMVNTIQHQWIGWALVQIMACRLFSAKTLPRSMPDYFQLDSWEQTSVKFWWKYQTFHSRKRSWDYRLQNGGYFVRGGGGGGGVNPYLLHKAVNLVTIIPSQRTSLDSDIGVSREVLVVATVIQGIFIVRVWWNDIGWDCAIRDIAVKSGWI